VAVGAGDFVGDSFEEELGALGGVDAVVEVAATSVFGFGDAGAAAVVVGDTGGPDLLVADGGEEGDMQEVIGGRGAGDALAQSGRVVLHDKGPRPRHAVDEEGRTFQADVGEGDLWNFPTGMPHSIQGLAGEGCEFLLVFDDGAFNEDETFLVTDFLAHIPPVVLAKNFGVSERAFASIPKSELYIFRSNVPGPLAQDRVVGAGPTPVNYVHRMQAQDPIRTRYGTVRITDSTNFPAASTIAAGLVEVEPGGMRELHWHRTSDEMQYYLEGQSRMTVYASNTNAGTFDYQAGDVGYVPKCMPHYVENTGTTTLRYLEVWSTDKFSDMSLAQWLAFTPYDLVRAHLQIDRSVLDRVSTTKTPVVGP